MASNSLDAMPLSKEQLGVSYARLAGALCRRDRRPITSNPFPKDSEEWLAYNAGWYQEVKEEKER